MGEVWSALDRRGNGEVAVKLSQRWVSTDPELAERFEREADLLARMDTPFVCKLIDVGRTADERPYIVLEKLEGETLEQLLKREGYLPMSEVGRIGDEILQALVVAHHAGIVHRDLSPANVFLHRTRSPERETITKVLDFGIAKVADTSGPRTGNRAVMGSLPYVAPEQLGDSATAGPRADIYAMGTLAFRALTGKLPYGDAQGTALVVLKREHDGQSIDEATGEKWPAALRTFLAKAIARTPSRRHASAEVALAAWRQAVRGKGPALDVPLSPDDASTLTLGDGGPPARRNKSKGA